MNILVLAGGISPERNVSLSSGSLIASALARRGHRVYLADIYTGVEDARVQSDPRALFTDAPVSSMTVGQAVPDLASVKAAAGGREELIGPGIMELCRAADVVFIALHGAMGENGQLQATLDNFHIPYTGTGYIGSLLAMDKDLSKTMFRRHGVPTPDWVYYEAGRATAEDILAKIGLPCVIKPCSCGSSVGVSIVRTEEQLADALALAHRYESHILAERLIVGREITMAVFDGEALPPVEIIPKDGFYDYKNKYQAGCTLELCPAPLTGAQLDRLAETAKRAFAALRLSDYARGDFIMDGEGQFWCLEFNTLPGMTPTSLLPQEAEAVGVSYDELCERIARMGLRKRSDGENMQ